MRTWLKNYLNSTEGQRLMARMRQDDARHISYPLTFTRFNAFDIKKEDIKVVVCGHAPLPDPNVSNGYAFSSFGQQNKQGDALINYIEYCFNNQIAIPRKYDFSRWAKQGVFLLNEHLTCRRDTGEPSPQVGWSNLFWSALEELVNDKTPKVIIMANDGRTGIAKARQLRGYIEDNELPHLIFLCKRGSTGFNYTTRAFLLANEFLIKHHRQPIRWQ